MEQVVRVRLSEDEKSLWVAAAHGELLTLSEWVRRACAARAGLDAGSRDRTGTGGDVVASAGPRHSLTTEAAVPASSPGPSVRALVQQERRSAGPCSADVARGTKCKLCGKVHYPQRSSLY